MKKIITAIVIALLSPSIAIANEDALYAPAPPADSAFVRTINATADTSIAIQLNGVSLAQNEEHINISDYAVFKQGNYDLTYGDKNEKIALEAGQYYSIAVKKDQSYVVIKEDLIENPSKAMLYFCNFSDAPASIKSPEYNATIFENIATSECTSREVNAVTFDLALEANDKIVKDLPGIALKRQTGTSIILIGNDVSFFDNQIAQ